MNNLSAAAEPLVELAEPGVLRIKVKSPSRYNFCENYHVGSEGWLGVATIEIIELKF